MGKVRPSVGVALPSVVNPAAGDAVRRDWIEANIAGGGSPEVIRAATAPAEPHSYKVWIDTSTTPPTVREWTGTAWQVPQAIPSAHDHDTLYAPASVMAVAGPEVAISAATTLDAAAFGKMHVLSGTTNYTVTLPGATGSAGEVIGFRVTPGATALVTIDGAGTERIDGSETRILWAQESVVLLCDGAGWTKIGGRSRPMVCRMRLQNSADPTRAQEILHNTTTPIKLNQADQDQGGMADPTNSRINIRRSSRYWVGYIVYYSVADATAAVPRALGHVEVTASPDAARVGVRPTQSEDSAYSASSWPGTTAGLPSQLLGGEQLTFRTFQNSGERRWLYGHPSTAATQLYALEAPTW